jgi:hypothetical protein
MEALKLTLSDILPVICKSRFDQNGILIVPMVIPRVILQVFSPSKELLLLFFLSMVYKVPCNAVIAHNFIRIKYLVYLSEYLGNFKYYVKESRSISKGDFNSKFLLWN